MDVVIATVLNALLSVPHSASTNTYFTPEFCKVTTGSVTSRMSVSSAVIWITADDYLLFIGRYQELLQTELT
jgi:hypothetical protein